MKYLGKTNEFVIDLDEAKYLAKQSESWDDSFENQKIRLAKAVLAFHSAALKSSPQGRRMAYGESTTF